MTNVSAICSILPIATAGTFPVMAKDADKRKRYFVKLDDETKRRLDFLTVDSGAQSTEAHGGALLTEIVDKLWASFDPKKSPAGKKHSK